MGGEIHSSNTPEENSLTTLLGIEVCQTSALIYPDWQCQIYKASARISAQLFLNKMALREAVIRYRIESVQDVREEVPATAQEN